MEEKPDQYIDSVQSVQELRTLHTEGASMATLMDDGVLSLGIYICDPG